MTRHTFDNAMCAHVWAQQTQDHGKSKSMSFAGPKLYSYGAIIGRFIDTIDGRRAVLLSNQKWSVTTSAHQSLASRAVPPSILTFYVPYMGEGYNPPDHVKNLESLISDYHAHIAGLKKRRDLYIGRFRNTATYAQTARNYAEAFGLPIPQLDHTADYDAALAYRAEREAKFNAPGQAEKREAERIKRAARKEAQEQRAREHALQSAAEAIAAWRMGERSHLPYGASRDTQGGAMLRIVGEVLETSADAKVPLPHAIRVFHSVAKCREAQAEWRSNGETIRVGNFTVDRITPDGTLYAGCHVIYWPEIESAARVAGVLP